VPEQAAAAVVAEALRRLRGFGGGGAPFGRPGGEDKGLDALVAVVSEDMAAKTKTVHTHE